MFDKYEVSKMPGHWLLARLGKKILRPGGVELTNLILKHLNIRRQDTVVELAPGIGATAHKILAGELHRYYGIDQNKEVVTTLSKKYPGNYIQFINANAVNTGLPDACASKVIGEAMLTMQSKSNKQQIINEAYRLLKRNGKYAIHEICLVPEDISDDKKNMLSKGISGNIHVNARPLTLNEWTSLFVKAGFKIKKVLYSPMHLLETGRLVKDEGVTGVLKIGFNALRTPGALNRVLSMRKMFRALEPNMKAISIIGIKP
ncbi:methyltransferase domain-containing protein [Cytophagaceae bacterium ABcell3]|nr:methyltransferase domain-containing protein [Cytophagaceae bacterium ABcell3]